MGHQKNDDSSTDHDRSADAPHTESTDQNNPAFSEQEKDSYAGRSDQDITANTGAGAGGATEFGGGNKNHPSRIASSTQAGQRR